MLRRIIAVLLGIVGGGMLVSFLQKTVHSNYPMPEDAHLMDKEAYFEFVRTLPTEAFLTILSSHFGGGLLAAFVAAALAITTKKQMGFIAGFVILIFTIVTLASVPHPSWMYIADPIAVIVAALIGGLVGSKVGQKV